MLPRRGAANRGANPSTALAAAPIRERHRSDTMALMSTTLDSTPAADGFRMPGEFEPHQGCWMLWPWRPDNWREGALPAQRAFAAVAEAISRFEPVTVGASRAVRVRARRAAAGGAGGRALSDDAWMRDVGPTFVVNDRGMRRGIDWRFNAWGGLRGGLYFPWDQDDLVARKVLEVERLDRYRAPFVNEGGAIHSDGEGTLLVTEQCLLNRNRNPQITGAQIEALLKAYTGATEVVWLGDGVFNDETDGHIDNLACFVAPGVVALLWTDDANDPQHEVCLDAWERLQRRARRARPPLQGPHASRCRARST